MFLWDLIDFQFQVDFFQKTLKKYETIYPPPYSPVLVLGNHDKRRWIDRLDGNLQKAKLVVLLQLTSRGVPVVYYGEEIGLPEGDLPARSSLDPIGQKYAWAPNWLLKALNLYVNRDNCRTPMVWDRGRNGSFTEESAEPWLPLSGDPASGNVADQTEDPESLLNWYRRLLHARKEIPALKSGSLELFFPELSPRGIVGYFRLFGSESYAVLVNFKASPVEIDLSRAEIVLSTGKVSTTPDGIHLGDLSGGLFRIHSLPAAKTIA
jgi:oligo-1,6-glucosidase/alpha-glucosidase